MFGFLFLGEYCVLDYVDAVQQGLARNPNDIYTTLDLINEQMAKAEADRDNALLANGLVFLSKQLSSSAYGMAGLVSNDEVLSLTVTLLDGDTELFRIIDASARTLLTGAEAVTEHYGCVTAKSNIAMHSMIKHVLSGCYLKAMIDLCGIGGIPEVVDAVAGHVDVDYKEIIRPLLVAHPQMDSLVIKHEVEHIAVSNFEPEEFDEVEDEI